MTQPDAAGCECCGASTDFKVAVAKILIVQLCKDSLRGYHMLKCQSHLLALAMAWYPHSKG